MLPYASIGKINLVPALGLARNMSAGINRKTSGCLSCPVYAAILRGETTEQKCAACKTKKTIYQNEKAKYGSSKDSLTSAELFVFLALHLYSPSSTGVIEEVSAKTLAEECRISTKTVYAALRGLEKKQYIHLNTDQRGSYTVLINDYEKYFEPANKGGRGYSVITQEIFQQLLSVKGSVNAVRYAIRTYLNIEMDAAKNINRDLTHSESVKQALSYMPKYFRPCHLKKILADSLPSMLSVVKDLGKNIVLRLDPSYFGKTAKQDFIEKEVEEFRRQFEGVLVALHKKEKGLISISDMTELELVAHTSLARLKGIRGAKIKPEDLISTKHSDLLSMVQISLDYGKERVLEALKKVWQHWKPGDGDQAAYIRTILAKEPVMA